MNLNKEHLNDFYDLFTRKNIGIEEVQKRTKKYSHKKVQVISMTITKDDEGKLICLEYEDSTKFYARARHIRCSDEKKLKLSETKRSKESCII